FQAEDGIRARNVTGVQTCALPIWSGDKTLDQHVITDDVLGTTYQGSDAVAPNSMITVDADIPPFQMDDHETRFVEWTAQSGPLRSEERREGKECRDGGGGAA